VTRLSLLIDADDTLWENNIYFERAFDAFCDFLDHSALSPPQVREILNEIELVNSKIHGYGSLNFGRNLQQAEFREERAFAKKLRIDADPHLRLQVSRQRRELGLIIDPNRVGHTIDPRVQFERDIT